MIINIKFCLLILIFFSFQALFCGGGQSRRRSVWNSDESDSGRSRQRDSDEGRRLMSLKPRSNRSESSDSSYDSEDEEDEAVKKIREELVEVGLKKPKWKTLKLSESDSGYDGDCDEDLTEDECAFFVTAFMKRLKEQTVRGMFETVFRLRTLNSRCYEILFKEKNKKKFLDALVPKNNNIRMIEVCAALGYAKELHVALSGMNEQSRKLFFQAKYLEDAKTILDYAEEFIMEELF